MHTSLSAVVSSNIAAFGYNVATSDLVVAFKSGSHYVYSGVPSDIITAFHAAPSKGKFLNVVIKQGGFPARPIPEVEVDSIMVGAEAATNAPKATKRKKAAPKVRLDDLLARYPFLQFAF